MTYMDPRPEGLNTEKAPESIVEMLKMPDLKTVTFDASRWQIVPKVPTDEILYAIFCNERDAKRAWKEALAAAPTPAAQSAGQEAVAWGVYWGVVRKKLAWPPYSTKGEAERAAEQIKSDIEVRPLYAAPVNGGEREQAIEEAAQIADTFKCGTCGMDGKCAAEIRKLKGKRAADAQQVGVDARVAELEAMLTEVTDCLAWLNSDDDGHIMALTDRARAALTSPAKDAQQKPMTDRQIIELCKSVGVEWEGPDMCDFMGDFGRVNMAGMRAVIAAAKEQK